MCKRSQITIFVILALIIIVVAILAVMLLKETSFFKPSAAVDPQAYISSCVKESLANSEKELLDANGFPNKTDNYIVYYGNKVPYLCKSSQFYMPCVNQEPALIEHFRQEILKRTSNDTEKCFAKLFDMLIKQDYIAKESGNKSIEINFAGSSITATIERTLTISENGESRTFDEFSSTINSPLYRLIDTARNIVNFESALCEFNDVTWMKNYRDISIKKFMTSDETKVYSLTDKDSGKKLEIAIKTCDLPAGI